MTFLIIFRKVMKLESFEWLDSLDVSEVFPLGINMHDILIVAYINQLMEFLVNATLVYDKKGSY